MAVPLVGVVRSGIEESVHDGDVAAVDATGRVIAYAGDPNRIVFARSAMKPLQAAVSLSLAGLELPDDEVAVMCASHNAEPAHVAAVRSILARAGLTEDALRCPPKRPWDEETLLSSPEPLRVNSDCSGKHAGMLAATKAQGWPLDSYSDPRHRYQQAVLRTVLAVSGRRGVRVGVDGCGVPVHAVTVGGMARIYASLVAVEPFGAIAPFATRAVAAMRARPYFVAGRNRVDTAVMERSPRLVVKGGAEGLLCAADLQSRVGVVVKIRDGSGTRATGPALVRALYLLRVLDEEDVEALAAFARPPVLGGGRPVGEMVAAFDLESA